MFLQHALVIAAVSAASCGATPTATRRVLVVGALNACGGGTPRAKASYEAFLAGLHEYCYEDGKTIRVECRSWTGGQTAKTNDVVARAASELASLPVDVIVANGGQAQAAAKAATATIPIVIYGGTDPVESGLVQDLARPGGNVTGVMGVRDVLSAKSLELLKEAAPSISRVAIFGDDRPDVRVRRKAAEAAAGALGLEVVTVEVHAASQVSQALDTMTIRGADALLVMEVSGAFDVTTKEAKDLIAYAAANRIPAAYPNQMWADAGGLMAFVDDILPIARRAGNYVGRILSGENPAEMPIEKPTKFELAINLKAAKALGLTIPQSLLIRATRVIE